MRINIVNSKIINRMIFYNNKYPSSLIVWNLAMMADIPSSTMSSYWNQKRFGLKRRTGKRFALTRLYTITLWLPPDRSHCYLYILLENSKIGNEDVYLDIVKFPPLNYFLWRQMLKNPSQILCHSNKLLQH